MLVFEKRENRSTWRKTSRCRVENQQTQPTYDAGSRNLTQDTLVEGKRSHHCAIPAPSLCSAVKCNKQKFFNFVHTEYKTCTCLYPWCSLFNPDVQADVGTEAVAMGETQNRRSWEDGWVIWSVFWDKTTDTNSKEWYLVIMSRSCDCYKFNLLTNKIMLWFHLKSVTISLYIL